MRKHAMQFCGESKVRIVGDAFRPGFAARDGRRTVKTAVDLNCVKEPGKIGQRIESDARLERIDNSLPVFV